MVWISTVRPADIVGRDPRRCELDRHFHPGAAPSCSPRHWSPPVVAERPIGDVNAGRANGYRGLDPAKGNWTATTCDGTRFTTQVIGLDPYRSIATCHHERPGRF